MATEMKLPQLGENVDQGIVLTVLVSSGERVERDQPLLELETDKATTEVPADFSGVIEEMRVEEGDEVEGGQTVLTYSAEEDEEAEETKTEEAAEQRDAEDQRAGEEEREVEEETEEVEEEAAKIEEEAEERPPKRAEKQRRRRPMGEKRTERRTERRPEKAPTPRMDEPVPASPAVRRFARELGVAISDVAGTGPGGRVVEDDVKSHVRMLLQQRTEEAPDGPELPDFSRWGDVERQPMTAIRRAVARNVSSSWEQIPHVSQFDRADITNLDQFKERFSDQVADEGGKLTVTAILLKVVAAALKHFPAFNSTLDLERAERIEKKYVHIGVAVDTDDGLLVPVLRNVGEKGLATVAAELTELSGRARARRLSNDEMTGASFTVTNLGGLGTTHFAPIIGWPQVAILAVGKAEIKPVYDGDEFVPRRMLPLGITYDHRAVDGADAARFLRWIAESIEEPLRLTMEGGR